MNPAHFIFRNLLHEWRHQRLTSHSGGDKRRLKVFDFLCFMKLPLSTLSPSSNARNKYLERIKHMRLKKAKRTHIAPWLGHYRTHGQNHVSLAVVRQPWIAVFDFVRPHQHSITARYLPRRVFTNPLKQQLHITNVVATVGNSIYYVLVWNARILSKSFFPSMHSFVHEMMNLFVCFLVPSALLFDPQCGTLHAAPIGWEVQFSTDFVLILIVLIQQ